MEHKSMWEMTLEARSDARKAVGPAQYSPWVLALSVSLAWGLLVFGTAGVYDAVGGGWAFGTFMLIVPFPVLVTAWVRKAWQVEGKRLDLAGSLLGLPELPALEVSDESEETMPVELRPGFEVNGEIVAPVGDSPAGAGRLRGLCLRFVRAGMRRDGWSRSKIAEGPGALMKGEDWDEASKELQRLNFFTKGAAGMTPSRDLGDIIKRLEAAR
jgi:hypothetical protein